MLLSSTIKVTTKFIAACALLIGTSTAIYAQTSDAKRALAVRAVAAQEGPEMNRMLAQLAGSATQQMVANWDERVSQLPEAKQQSAINAMDAELKKFNDDALKLITAQAAKVRGDALLNAYIERFSEEELKQLVALMEAPVFKKYQSVGPDLGGVYIKAIVDGTRSAVEARSKTFDTAAAKIVGVPAAPPSGASNAPAKKP
ncbi:MAG: DUF2059 domain-containing protein [Burkholderiaceae bacterium]